MFFPCFGLNGPGGIDHHSVLQQGGCKKEQATVMVNELRQMVKKIKKVHQIRQKTIFESVYTNVHDLGLKDLTKMDHHFKPLKI